MRSSLLPHLKTVPLTYRHTRLESGWRVIQVLREHTVVGLIIKKSDTAPYRYFVGTENQIAYEYEHRDLDALKAMIERAPAGLSRKS